MAALRLLPVLLALFMLADADADAAKKKLSVKSNGTYTGLTSQGSVCRVGERRGAPCSVTVVTSDKGSFVKRVDVLYHSNCQNGQGATGTVAFRWLAISKARFRINSTSDAADSTDPATKIRRTIALGGRFERSSKGTYSVSGTTTVVSDRTYGDGTTTQCTTGPVTWTARLAP
jgi:hypothetical protein